MSAFVRATVDDWALAELFLVRVAGLPAEVLDDLHSVRSAAWAQAVLAREDELHAVAAPVPDALAAAVARHVDDAELRRQLINLRRDAFNVRIPKDPPGARALVARLDAPTGGLVADWLAACEAYVTELAGGADAATADRDHQREVLRRVSGEPALRNGLLLASPMLDQQLPSYLDAGSTLGKRARRVERSLMEYTARTAAKTSPFSSLTSVCLGRFEAGEPAEMGEWSRPALVRLAQGGRRAAGFARLNVVMLARLAAAALDSNELRAGLPVRLTAGWSVDRSLDRSRLRYLRHRHTATGGDEDAVAIDLVHEDLFFLPGGGLIAEVLAVLGDAAPMRLGDLVDRLAHHGPRAEVQRYVDHLLRLGLLVVPALRVDINADNPVRAFGVQLRHTGLLWACAVDDSLCRVDEVVRAYPNSALPHRRELLAAIRAELTATLTALGKPTATTPRTILYEDTALRATAVGSGPQWTKQFLPAFSDIARLLPAFDVNVPRRISTKGYFRARFGRGARCDDFLSFAHLFDQDFFEQYTERLFSRRAFDAEHRYVPLENWFHQDEMSALDNARTALVALVTDRHLRLPPGATDLVLDPNDLRAITDALPDRLDTVRSWSFFAQLADAGHDRPGEQPLVVLNRSYPGLTLQFSRFAHCFADGDGETPATLVRELRTMLDRVQPPGSVFAELKGGYDETNLNLHPAVTPFELVCPGEASFRPAAEQIPVDDLYLVDDVAADRLRLCSRRLACEVIPVYLGFLVPILLPRIQQVLLTFAGAGMAQPDLWAGVPAAAADDPVVALPRIRYRNVVLQRRTWRVRTDTLPRQQVDESGNFLGWARWRRRYGVPRRVFATARAQAVQDTGHERGKPLYVDFEQHLSLSLLADLAEGAQQLVLTEMLPDRDQLWLRDGTHSYVAELAIQLTTVPVTPAGSPVREVAP